MAITKLPANDLYLGTVKIATSAGALVVGGTAITATAAQLNGTAPALTSPTMSNPVITYTIGAHDYAGAAVDWTLSAAELAKQVQHPTNANGAVNAIIAVTAGKPYTFINTTGQALTVKTPSGTGVVIASAKTATVMSDGTNVIRLTPDA